MATTTVANQVDSQGRPVRFSREIGRGGEGTVYAIEGRAKVVAKVFRAKPDARQSTKLKAMLASSSNRLRTFSAWPIDTIRDPQSSQVTGILMPLIRDAKPFHLLCSPKSRRTEFPAADWRFLVRAGLNIARAFHAVHDAGHIIGDVNEQNILISKDATVTFIDCDSFQISSNGQVFPCDVGVPTFTPPELQGERLRGLLRNRNHDAFGLAVLIFHLLVMGRHPFAGRYLGSGDQHIPDNIREFRFAYGVNANAHLINQPPGTLPLSAFPAPIRDVFEQAFSRNGAQPNGRPDADTWIRALQQFEGKLAQCRSNSNHYSYVHNQHCVWCRLEQETGADYFPPPRRSQADRQFPPPTVDTKALDEAWKRITSVRPPPKTQPAPAPSDFTVTPNSEAVKHGKLRRQRLRFFYLKALKFVAGPAVLTALIIGVVGDPGIAFLFIIGALVAIWAAGTAYSTSQSTAVRSRMSQERTSAAHLYQEGLNQWQYRTSDARFQTKLWQLEQHRTAYLKLLESRKKREEEMMAVFEATEFTRHLKRQKIADAAIPGIGVARAALLKSNGIESAADIFEERLTFMPKIGPTLMRALITWRKQQERAFTFDSKQGLPPSDRKELERTFGTKQSALLGEIRGGEAALRGLVKEIEAARLALRSTLEARARDLAHAQANWDAL